MADAKRQLHIRTAGLKRVTKELAVYLREEEAESARVKTLRASGADSHDLKHAVGREGPTLLRKYQQTYCCCLPVAHKWHGPCLPCPSTLPAQAY